MLLSNSKAADRQYGPEGGLADSERHRPWAIAACFPGAPCYERFIALTSRVWTLLVFFLASRMGRKTDIYYIDSTPLPVCHKDVSPNTRFSLAWRQEERPAWAGFSASNCISCSTIEREIVACQLTPGNAADTTPVPGLTKDLSGKLFGDKGYIGQKLAQELLHRGCHSCPRDARSLQHEIPASFFPRQSPAQWTQHRRDDHRQIFLAQAAETSLGLARLHRRYRRDHRLPDRSLASATYPRHLAIANP